MQGEEAHVRWCHIARECICHDNILTLLRRQHISLPFTIGNPNQYLRARKVLVIRFL